MKDSLKEKQINHIRKYPYIADAMRAGLDMIDGQSFEQMIEYFDGDGGDGVHFVGRKACALGCAAIAEGLSETRSWRWQDQLEDLYPVLRKRAGEYFSRTPNAKLSNLIVYMNDKQHMSIEEISKEIIEYEKLREIV